MELAIEKSKWIRRIRKDVSGGSHLIFVIMEEKNRYGDLFFNILLIIFSINRGFLQATLLELDQQELSLQLS